MRRINDLIEDPQKLDSAPASPRAHCDQLPARKKLLMMNCCVCARFAHDRMRGLEDAGPRPFFASSWACSPVLKIASPPLLSYHLSTVVHLHQPASFCVDTFLLCLPLRCGCSSFPALLGLHVDLLCIAALLRHLGEFPFPSGFSLLPLAAICDSTPQDLSPAWRARRCSSRSCAASKHLPPEARKLLGSGLRRP